MCGIAGFCNFCGKPALQSIVLDMAETLKHRGPDGMGALALGNAALGHVRLAVIDLTDAAAQPFSADDNTCHIAYNGEIYNHRELRQQLVSLGYHFYSRSDTEVVLNAWRQWGQDCVNRFNGMFAFCILDMRKRGFFLARDRYGIKPLYYGVFGNTFMFASEAKAFLRHPDFRAELDTEALVEYMTFQNILTGRTFFKNVSLAPAGCYAFLPLDGTCAINFTRYWDFCFQEKKDMPEGDEAEEELDRLFAQAVRRTLVSDVEIGAYLSGGIDSGFITAMAAQELPYLKSFTCGFDLSSAQGIEIAFDEREKSEYLSALFKTEHYECVLKSGDLERVMPKLAWHLEEPRLGQSYPNFYAAKLASRFTKVVLSGCGGDELFGGYPWRYYRAANCRDFEDYIDRYYGYWQRLIPNSRLKPLLEPVKASAGHVWTRDIFRSVFDGCEKSPDSFAASVNMSLYFEAKTFLHGLLLLEDKLAMAHGLETRVPFLDNDLADFAMSLPVTSKLHDLEHNASVDENMPGKTRNWWKKHSDGKHILRNVMGRYVPEYVSQAPKQGFSGPDASWFRGESIDYLKRTILMPNAAVWNYLDLRAGTELVNEHLAGIENRRLFIWALLSVEWWLRKFL